ncbi:MAG: prepilin peptidase [Candidatus Binatia bacterium]
MNFTLFAVVSLAAFFDIKERRIPNWVVLSGLLGGIVLGVFQGSTQLVYSLVGFFGGILALLIPFAFGWMGAGDVKLFGAVGALIGYKTLPRVFFYSCIIAGVLALAALALGHAKQTSFRNIWADCKLVILTAGHGRPQTGSKLLNPGAYSVPWGVAIGAGTIMAYYFDPTGKWAGF